MEASTINTLLTDSLLHYLPTLYPDIKVPVAIHAEYYINQLRQSDQFDEIDSRVHLITDMLDKHGEQTEFGPRVTHYKRRMLGKFLAMWKEKEWEDALNAMPPNKTGMVTMEAPCEAGYYVSVDIVSANFSVCNHYLNLGAPNWFQFCIRNMPEMHWALVKSKSFRQNLFGNTNPKRIQNLTAGLTLEYIKSLETCHPDLHSRIVGISHDEIVLSCRDMDDMKSVCKALKDIIWYPRVPLKTTAYYTEPIKNEGKDARVDSVFVFEGVNSRLMWKRLRGIAGNRFHTNFQTHVVGGNMNTLDRMFMLDGRVAKWMD